ncbi:MAG: hypothetical protein ICV81_05090 [Flavisolibacter sp.]|nr:hypothetical protein [Flavisolibacter sp.]MBD0286896.1 hypothetical protein [Flavisolibacter sp.]MBD0366880.1 hypothetical protein [Flavisolibacter sp.]
MKNKSRKHKSNWVVSGEGSAEAGKSMNPEQLQDDDASANQTVNKEVPIGLPVSIEEYKKMKEAAKTKTLPSGGKAQVDPSADKSNNQ